MKNRKPRRIRKEHLAKDHITPIRKIITLLDGYRINKFKDPSKLAKSVESGAAGTKVKRNWDRIWKILYDLTKLTSKIPKAVKHLRYFSLVNTSSGLVLAVSAVLLILHFILNIPWVIGGAFLISTLSIILLLRSYLMRKIALSIEEYANIHPEKFEKGRLFIRNFNQELIFDLRRFFGQSKLNPEDYPFHIYNLDYKGIKVVKEPSWIRKSTIATIRID